MAYLQVRGPEFGLLESRSLRLHSEFRARVDVSAHFLTPEASDPLGKLASSGIETPCLSEHGKRWSEIEIDCSYQLLASVHMEHVYKPHLDT